MMTCSFIETLCCPSCKDKLVLTEEIYDSEKIVRGNLVCGTCKEVYPIDNGIPQFYIPDDDVIGRTYRTKFDDFIITADRLAALAEDNRPKKRLGELSNRKFRLCVVLAAWLAAIMAGIQLIFAAAAGASFSLEPAYLFILASLVLFVADYILFRVEAKDRFESQLHRLLELNRASKLSEYDSRLEIKDKKDCYSPLSGPSPKAKKIAATLKQYGFEGGRGLNIGCGGELHQLVSRPFFDQGFNMVGLDICMDYLAEYRKIFNADVMLANSLALPLANNLFDVINYTDILEHLHHPYLGLCEANRVLKDGGKIILATPYRCRFSPQCVNPLIFLEAMESLYYDKILGPRNLLSGFQDMAYYHLEFSKSEITDMLESAGFEVFSFDTYFAKSGLLTALFQKFPVLRLMGGSIMVIGVKRHAEGLQSH